MDKKLAKGATNQSESMNGAVVFIERLLPGFLVWLLIAFMTISLGIAYGYVYGSLFGSLITLISTAGIYVFMFISSPVIALTNEELQVGNAKLPIQFIGTPRILDSTQTAESIRKSGHADAYTIFRASKKESILFEITDQSDPHPYWQFSTRNPEILMSEILKIKNKLTD